jgi:Flp pilus assembly protein TadB
MTRSTIADLILMIRSRYFWHAMARFAMLLAAALAMLAIAFTALIVVLPLALIGGIGLHFYLRRRLRRRSWGSSGQVIETEYTVIDRP